jgi:hypothetical protein
MVRNNQNKENRRNKMGKDQFLQTKYRKDPQAKNRMGIASLKPRIFNKYLIVIKTIFFPWMPKMMINIDKLVNYTVIFYFKLRIYDTNLIELSFIGLHNAIPFLIKHML